MSTFIGASWDTLMNQAPSTVQLYMIQSIRNIDREFGEGYAESHPEFLAAYMKLCSEDFRTSAISVAADKISCAIQDLASASRGS